MEVGERAATALLLASLDTCPLLHVQAEAVIDVLADKDPEEKVLIFSE